MYRVTRQPPSAARAIPRKNGQRIEPIPPAGGWVEVEIPMAGFEAKVYGRAIPGVGPPDTTRIESLGFMISDKQAGPFRLEIDWIAVKCEA